MSIDSTAVTAGVNAVADDHNNLRKDLLLGKNIAPTALTDGVTITIDWSDVTKGKYREVTIAGNRTLAFTNYVKGQYLILRVIQGGSGSNGLTYPTTTKFSFGVNPTLSVDAGKEDWLVFFCTDSAGPTFVGFQAATVV